MVCSSRPVKLKTIIEIIFLFFLNEGQQLGAGCFGQVVKAEAVGIVDIESVTTVAVKMVRANAQSNDALSSLIRELKILIYLGSHVNVVNLLGACTKSISKGEIKNQNLKLNIKSFYGHFFYFAEELLVIIDYCRFGNLQTYLTQQRETFIDQLNEFGDLPSRSEAAGEMELFKRYVNNYENIKSKTKNRSTSIFD